MKKHGWRAGEFECEMADLIGRTFTRVAVSDDKSEMYLQCSDGVFTFYHDQDCCEGVAIYDITGDFSDLVGSPILVAEESTSDTHPAGYVAPKYEDSFTWTFYKLATVKGWVDIRWLGESNGYYSEGVSLMFVAHAIPT